MPHRDDSDNEGKKGLMYSVVGGILIAGCCWSLGYGYSQATLASTVSKVSMSIDHIRELQIADRKAFEDADGRLSRDLAEQRSSSSEHMKVVVGLMQKVTEQNQELIAFLKAQVIQSKNP